jgi:hypothetical protein
MESRSSHHDRDRARRRHVEPRRMLIGSTGSPAVERKIATTTAMMRGAARAKRPTDRRLQQWGEIAAT